MHARRLRKIKKICSTVVALCKGNFLERCVFPVKQRGSVIKYFLPYAYDKVETFKCPRFEASLAPESGETGERDENVSKLARPACAFKILTR